MRSSIAAVPLLASAFIGCAEPAPTSPPTLTTFTAPPLPLPPVISQVDTGTCELTHLGRAALYGELEINFATGTQSGWRTLTAANGDELYLAVTGRNAGAVGGLVTIDAQLTIVGGTGRFAGATGSARGTGTANLATRSTSVSIEGTIND